MSRLTLTDLEALDARARNGFAHPEELRLLLAEVRRLQALHAASLEEITRLKEELRSARLTLISRMEQ